MAEFSLEEIIKEGVEQAMKEPIADGLSVTAWAAIGMLAPRWISVKDRLPENHSCCLVSDGSGISFGFYGDGAWEGIPTEIDVRWWMLIPEPPKEENVDERTPD